MRILVAGLLASACFFDGGLPATGEVGSGDSGSTTVTTTSMTGTSGAQVTTSEGPEATSSSSASAGSSGTDDTGAPVSVPSLCGLTFGTWRVGPPELLAFNSGKDEIDPVLLSDLRTLLYSNAGVSRRALRVSPGEPFGADSTLNSDFGLSLGGQTIRVVFTPDWLTAYVGTNQDGGAGLLDVWRMTRVDIESKFGGAEVVAPLNSPLDDFDHLLSADGLRMYLAPMVNADTKQQVLMIATRGSTAEEFSPPAPIAELQDGFSDGSPALPADERTMIFSSQRSGVGDLYVSVRTSLAEPFSDPVPLDEVNDPSRFDGEPFLSSDGCELFFASNRGGGVGGWDLYRADILAGP